VLTALLDAAAIARLVPARRRHVPAGPRPVVGRRGHPLRERRHRDPPCPLRRDGLLPAICGVEFALQAMALHGALTAAAPQPMGLRQQPARAGLGASALDDVPGALRIEATALAPRRAASSTASPSPPPAVPCWMARRR
jgi:hypothetical protein